MNLKFKKSLDAIAGGSLIFALRWIAKIFVAIDSRDLDLKPRGKILLIKLLGGGSLVTAYPALLGVKRAYPNLEFVLLTTPSIVPFAKSLNVFDSIVLVNDKNAVSLILSTWRVFKALLTTDTLINFEVHSRLTTVLSFLSFARLRLGFLLEVVEERRHFFTHLVYFNRFYSVGFFYNKICTLLSCGTADVLECRKSFLAGHLRISSDAANAQFKSQADQGPASLVIGPFCSDLALERMLSPKQWQQYLERRQKNLAAGLTIHILGGKQDFDAGQSLQTLLQNSLNEFGRVDVQVKSHAGTINLIQSLGILISSQEFWGVDSSLLHYARLLGLKCVSFWGPTSPSTRLIPIPDLNEELHYVPIPCSPCVHVAESPPCGGNNVCISVLFEKDQSLALNFTPSVSKAHQQI